MTYIATVDGHDFTVEVPRPGEVAIDGRAHVVDLRPIDGEYLFSLLLDGESYEAFVERREGRYYVSMAGDRFAVEVEDARMRGLKAAGRAQHAVDGAVTIEAPMPGLVVRVLTKVGQVVAEDEGLVILEAMKMENEVRSPRRGVVTAVEVRVGQAVNGGDVLMVVGEE
jgi:biotin carboxyl carrier protein